MIKTFGRLCSKRLLFLKITKNPEGIKIFKNLPKD